MPQSWPQYDPNDPNNNPDDEGAQYQANLAQMDADSGIGDSDPHKLPQWAAQGPQSMPHAAQDAAAAGAQPPAMPNPSIWRKILSGAVGGMAGLANVSAGRPGGPSQPINAAPATANILGTNDYNRKLANWSAGEKQKDAAATLERNHNEDALKYREVMARVGEANSTTALNNDTRKQNATTRSQAEIDAFQKGKFGADTATRPDLMFGPPPSDNPPLQSNQSNLNANADDKDNTNPNAEQAIQAADLPVTAQETELNGMPEPPQMDTPPIPGMPSMQQPVKMAGGTKPGFNPAQAPKGYTGPPLYNADPGKQREMTAQATQDAKTSDWETMSPELHDQLTKSGVLVRTPVGQKYGPQEGNRMEQDYDARTKAAAPVKVPQTADDLMALRSAGATTGFPEYDKYDPEVVKRAQASKHPANQPVVTGMTGADGTPGPVAVAIANYRLAPPIMRGNSPAAISAYNAEMAPVYAANKDYDATLYPEALNWNSSKKGSTGGNILSLNTVAAHADDFINDIAALNNGDIRSVNYLSNLLGTEFGSDAMQNAQVAKEAVVTEIAAALKGAGAPAASEIRSWADSLKPNMSEQQRNGAKQTLAKLFGRRLDAMQAGYVAKFKKPYDNILTDPQAEEFLRSGGYDVNSIKTGKRSVGGPPAGGGAKMAPLAAVQAYAAQNRVDINVAKKHFTDAGWQIGQ